jgi:dihydroorotate dehydrogenase (NAD+) catalytic subunit
MSLQKLKRTVCGITFPYPVMVGGGVFKTAPQLTRVVGSDIIPEWGSITTLPRNGNGGRNYYANYYESVSDEQVLCYTLNSLGLPNPGMDYVETHAPDLLRLYADHDKPLAINVSGEDAEDLARLVVRALKLGFKVITANGACPNGVTSGGARIPVLCYDEKSVFNFFSIVGICARETDALVLWKVANGMPHEVLAMNLDRVAQSTVVKGVITGNTIGNTFRTLPDGRPAIETENGITRGGLAGPEIFVGAVAATAYSRAKLPEEKIVVGCGGVCTARDALEYLQAGATLVQLVSAFREANEKPKFITDLLYDLRELL